MCQCHQIQTVALLTSEATSPQVQIKMLSKMGKKAETAKMFKYQIEAGKEAGC